MLFLLWPAYLTQGNVFKVYPCCGICWNVLPVLRLNILHCMNRSPFAYPLIPRWAWVVSTFWLLWIALLWVWVYKHLFVQSSCLKVLWAYAQKWIHSQLKHDQKGPCYLWDTAQEQAPSILPIPLWSQTSLPGQYSRLSLKSCFISPITFYTFNAFYTYILMEHQFQE